MGIRIDDDGTVYIDNMVVGGAGITVQAGSVTVGPVTPRRPPHGVDVDAIVRDAHDVVRSAGNVVENNGVMNIGSGSITITNSTVCGERVNGQTIRGYVQG